MAICGACGTCIGAWVKTFSVQPDLFWLGFIGQSIVAASQVFILSLPARVAAVWFGPNQVSSACSIGVFGNQLGVAVGFVLPSILVKNHDDLELVGDDLKFMFTGIAIFTTVLLALMILCKYPCLATTSCDDMVHHSRCKKGQATSTTERALVTFSLLVFKAAPPTSPSAAQSGKDNDEFASGTFMSSLKRLLFNRNYILLLLSYGMNVGVFYAISTLLNQVSGFEFTFTINLFSSFVSMGEKNPR